MLNSIIYSSLDPFNAITFSIKVLTIQSAFTLIKYIIFSENMSYALKFFIFNSWNFFPEKCQCENYTSK